MKNLVVLMGGWSSEREVSLKTGSAVVQSLDSSSKYKVKAIDVDKDLIKILQTNKPDVAFIALHGLFGEDGRIQSILDLMEIPYTHSGALASAICLDKFYSKQLVKDLNICTPKGIRIFKSTSNKDKVLKQVFNNSNFPLIIKPVNEGFSKNTFIMEDNNFSLENDYNWDLSECALVEQYIAGNEFSVLCLGKEAVGAIEIEAGKTFFDELAKSNSDTVKYLPPKTIEVGRIRYTELLELATSIHNYLGCKDISRIDFILNEKDDRFYFLEVNTHPGLTEFSLAPRIAQHFKDLDLNILVEQLIENASYHKLVG